MGIHREREMEAVGLVELLAAPSAKGRWSDSCRAVFVKGVVRRIHAASVISGALISVSGLSQPGPAVCQFRVLRACISVETSAACAVQVRIVIPICEGFHPSLGICFRGKPLGRPVRSVFAVSEWVLRERLSLLTRGRL